MTLKHLFRRIRAAALLALAVALPGQAGALSGSKLGPHVLGNANDDAALLIQDACPRVAKWLAGSGEVGAIQRYRGKCPGGTVVIRVFVPGSVHYGVNTDPIVAANDFWSRIAGQLSETPPSMVDWVEGANELDNVDDWYHNGAAASWFAGFSSRLADLIHNAGYNPLLGSIAVGNPALGGELGFGPKGAMEYLANVIKSKPYKVGWSYHAYDNVLFNANEGRYWSLRYRTIRDQAGLAGVPIVLTEGGQDGPGGGWKNRTSGDQYFSWLKWLDGELKKDAEVAGVTLFQVGQHADWSAFDLGPIADKLAAYIKGSDDNTPPPPPPPAPRPVPGELVANDGSRFADQPAEVQRSFASYWGSLGIDGERRWVGEHNMDIIDSDWREKTGRGELVPNASVGCLDNPVAAPPGYQWTARCPQSCASNSECPSGANGASGWCFGFPGGNRCMRLDPLPMLGG